MPQLACVTIGRIDHSATPRRERRRLLDATQLLEADHRRIERLLRMFERCRTRERKAELCDRICAFIFLHATLEEEIFFPAFVAATGQRQLHRLAEAGHRTCIHMVAQIDCAEVTDEHFDARMQVLADVVRHYIRGEEMSGGIFDVARRSGMDLFELGTRLRSRKYRLERGLAAPRRCSARAADSYNARTRAPTAPQWSRSASSLNPAFPP